MAKQVYIVVHAVRLPGELRGLDRHPYIAELLSNSGYDVTLVTSRFQHWDKKHRLSEFINNLDVPYNVAFIDEPGYKKNVDLRRLASQAVFTRNFRRFLSEHASEPDVIICNVPSNKVSAACARFASEHSVPLVADLNDLWPEAMRMIVDVPILCDIAYEPMIRQAKTTYNQASCVVGTSIEYAEYPYTRYGIIVPHTTIYVGIDLEQFDRKIVENSSKIEKFDEIWVTYAGTVGASYGLATLIQSAAKVGQVRHDVRFKIIGDGPDLVDLRRLSDELKAPVDFLGYREHGETAAWLSKSDLLVNSLRKNAPQSVPSKIADYLAAGKPIVNTGASDELVKLLSTTGCGISVAPGNADALAEGINTLLDSDRQDIGKRSRMLAEKSFDRNKTYQTFATIVEALC